MHLVGHLIHDTVNVCNLIAKRKVVVLDLESTYMFSLLALLRSILILCYIHPDEFIPHYNLYMEKGNFSKQVLP
jgi:hypothetical protein